MEIRIQANFLVFGSTVNSSSIKCSSGGLAGSVYCHAQGIKNHPGVPIELAHFLSVAGFAIREKAQYPRRNGAAD
jgi:hypothetical protein